MVPQRSRVAGLRPWRRWRRRHGPRGLSSHWKQTASRRLLSHGSLLAAEPLPPTALPWASYLGGMLVNAPRGLTNGSPTASRLHLDALARPGHHTAQLPVGTLTTLEVREPPPLNPLPCTPSMEDSPGSSPVNKMAVVATLQNEEPAVPPRGAPPPTAPPPTREGLVKTAGTKAPGLVFSAPWASPGAEATSFFGPVGISPCCGFCSFSKHDWVAITLGSTSDAESTAADATSVAPSAKSSERKELRVQRAPSAKSEEGGPTPWSLHF